MPAWQKMHPNHLQNLAQHYSRNTFMMGIVFTFWAVEVSGTSLSCLHFSFAAFSCKDLTDCKFFDCIFRTNSGVSGKGEMGSVFAPTKSLKQVCREGSLSSSLLPFDLDLFCRTFFIPLPTAWSEALERRNKNVDCPHYVCVTLLYYTQYRFF